jgi:putative transposase
MPMPNFKTVRRTNDPGHAHTLTFSCFQRRPFLMRERTRGWFVDAVERFRKQYDFHVWAYVIMPEHIHILIWPTKSVYDIGIILKALKKSVSNHAVAWLRKENSPGLQQLQDRQPNGKVHFRFWQRGGGYDLNVFEPMKAHRQIDYIHNNPVRRNLCPTAVDWFWSSAADYAGLRTGPLRIDSHSVPMFAPE